MSKTGAKTLILYLEDWQKRMVKDLLNIDCDRYEVEITDPANHRYGVQTREDLKRMYFTDWQIREMKDITGSSCEFVELKKEGGFHSLYGVFTRPRGA